MTNAFIELETIMESLKSLLDKDEQKDLSEFSSNHMENLDKAYLLMTEVYDIDPLIN